MNPEVILSFCGYGNPTGRVWFVGNEEGLGGMTMADTLHNLEARSAWQVVMPLQEAHLTLHANGARIDLHEARPNVGHPRIRSPVWDYQAKFMRCLEGRNDWMDIGPARHYVADHLGVADRETFLTEISPIPAADRGCGQVWRAFMQYVYGNPIDGLLMQRQAALVERLQGRPPGGLVVCYGRRQECLELFNIQGYDADHPIHHGSYFAFLPFFGNGNIAYDQIQAAVNQYNVWAATHA